MLSSIENDTKLLQVNSICSNIYSINLKFNLKINVLFFHALAQSPSSQVYPEGQLEQAVPVSYMADPDINQLAIKIIFQS